MDYKLILSHKIPQTPINVILFFKTDFEILLGMEYRAPWIWQSELFLNRGQSTLIPLILTRELLRTDQIMDILWFDQSPWISKLMQQIEYNRYLSNRYLIQMNALYLWNMGLDRKMGHYTGTRFAAFSRVCNYIAYFFVLKR